MTTARDKFFYTRTLCCLLKALEGVETEIELRNESHVKGTVESVSGSMSVTMRNCELIVAGRVKKLQRLYVQGRKIRMVVVPDEIDMINAMQSVINMYNISSGGRNEFKKKSRGRGSGRGRGLKQGRGIPFVSERGKSRGNRSKIGRGTPRSAERQSSADNRKNMSPRTQIQNSDIAGQSLLRPDYMYQKSHLKATKIDVIVTEQKVKRSDLTGSYSHQLKSEKTRYSPQTLVLSPSPGNAVNAGDHSRKDLQRNIEDESSHAQEWPDTLHKHKSGIQRDLSPSLISESTSEGDIHRRYLPECEYVSSSFHQEIRREKEHLKHKPKLNCYDEHISSSQYTCRDASSRLSKNIQTHCSERGKQLDTERFVSQECNTEHRKHDSRSHRRLSSERNSSHSHLNKRENASDQDNPREKCRSDRKLPPVNDKFKDSSKRSAVQSECTFSNVQFSVRDKSHTSRQPSAVRNICESKSQERREIRSTGHQPGLTRKPSSTRAADKYKSRSSSVNYSHKSEVSVNKSEDSKSSRKMSPARSESKSSQSYADSEHPSRKK